MHFDQVIVFLIITKHMLKLYKADQILIIR